MSHPSTRLWLEALETRDLPTPLIGPVAPPPLQSAVVRPATPAPHFDLSWNYLTYNPSPTTSLAITGQVIADNPAHLTGKFQVQLYWSDAKGNHRSPITALTFQLTRTNYRSVAFHLSAQDLKSHPRPAGADHVTGVIIPLQLPDGNPVNNTIVSTNAH